jgi:hypothetical protein
MALRPCRDCGNKVSTKATACPKCGRLVNQPSSLLGCTSGCMVISLIGVLGFMALAYFVGPSSKSPQPRPIAPPITVQEQPMSPSVMSGGNGSSPVVGQEATIPDPDFPIGSDWETFQELEHLHSAGDSPGIKELFKQDRGFRVAGGSRVLILEEHGNAYRIRVLPGRIHEGREGYIPKSWVKVATEAGPTPDLYAQSLPAETRREIHRRYKLAEREIVAEGHQRFPATEKTTGLTPADGAEIAEYSRWLDENRDRMAEGLRQEFSISEDILSKIQQEGFDKQWDVQE